MSSGAPQSIDQAVAQVVSGTQVLAAHAQHLGADVAQADARMQEQRTVTRSAAAQELFNMLSKPDGMRQIVIASEILRRPEDRWVRQPQASNLQLRG